MLKVLKLINSILIDHYMNNLTHIFWLQNDSTSIQSFLNEDQDDIELLIKNQNLN